jgi:O-antigen/teichoic acid export membrane protein
MPYRHERKMPAWNKSVYLNWRNSVPAIMTSPMAIAGSGSLLLRIAAMGIGFLQSVLAARLLGIRDYGVFAFINAVVAIAATLALLGIAPLAVRELARMKAIAAWEKAAGFFRVSKIAVFGASVLAGAAISGFALLIPGLAYRNELALAGLLIPPTSMLLLFQSFGRGLGAVVRGQVPVSLIRPAVMLAIFAAFFFGAARIDAFGAVLVLFLASVAALGFAAVILRRILPAEHLKRRAPLETRKHFRNAASFFAMSVAIILQANGITLLLTWLSGPEQAGLFQPVAFLAPIMVIGLDTITMPLAPRIAHLWELGDVARLRKTLRTAMLVATAITVCVIAGILVLGPFILGAFGKEFVAVQPALLWIACAQMINAASGHVDSLLAMTSHQRDVLKCQIMQLLVNLGLGVMLIPGLGAQGAAISLAGGIVIFNAGALFYARKRLGFDPALPGLILTAYSNQQRGSA